MRPSSDEMESWCPEVHMRHYDGDTQSSKGQQMQALAAKEASFIQACGYTPCLSMSNQLWEDELHRETLVRTKQITAPDSLS